LYPFTDFNGSNLTEKERYPFTGSRGGLSCARLEAVPGYEGGSQMLAGDEFFDPVN
jgi:hypothetical protein